MNGSNFKGLKYKGITIKVEQKNIVVYLFNGLYPLKVFKFARLLYDHLLEILYDLNEKIYLHDLHKHKTQLEELIVYIEYNQGYYDN